MEEEIMMMQIIIMIQNLDYTSDAQCTFTSSPPAD